MKILELTRPDGEKIYVNPSMISAIVNSRSPYDDQNARVDLADENSFHVCETPETIARMCGGKVTDRTVTLTKLMDETIAEVCDKICRYAHEPIPEGKDEDWLFEEGGPCDRCPLNKLGV